MRRSQASEGAGTEANLLSGTNLVTSDPATEIAEGIALIGATDHPEKDPLAKNEQSSKWASLTPDRHPRVPGDVDTHKLGAQAKDRVSPLQEPDGIGARKTGPGAPMERRWQEREASPAARTGQHDQRDTGRSQDGPPRSNPTRSGNRSASPRTVDTTGTGGQSRTPEGTRVCTQFEKTGNCTYGSKYKFAHIKDGVRKNPLKGKPSSSSN